MENRNLDTGEAVRVIETYQDWFAELICRSANERFAAAGRRHQSYVIEIR